MPNRDEASDVPGEWAPNDRKLFVAECVLCERLDALGHLEDSIEKAALANSVLIASFSTDPDGLHGIDSLFSTAIETANFKFADDAAAWQQVEYLTEAEGQRTV